MKPLKIKRAALPRKIRERMPKGKNKMHAQAQVREGRHVASLAEARRLAELRLEARAGGIQDLRVQVRYPLEVNGVRVCTYVADFVYRRRGAWVVEDVKGHITATYRINRALMLALHGIKILETK